MKTRLQAHAADELCRRFRHAELALAHADQACVTALLLAKDQIDQLLWMLRNDR